MIVGSPHKELCMLIGVVRDERAAIKLKCNIGDLVWMRWSSQHPVRSAQIQFCWMGSILPIRNGHERSIARMGPLVAFSEPRTRLGRLQCAHMEAFLEGTFARRLACTKLLRSGAANPAAASRQLASQAAVSLSCLEHATHSTNEHGCQGQPKLEVMTTTTTGPASIQQRRAIFD